MFCPVCRADYPVDWKVCPKDATSLLRSTHIGKYAIEGLIGVGGMGAVYRASNPDTRSEVAIKVMNADVAGATDARQRFQREAAAVAKLRTSHVVKVNDFGTEADGTLYLVMELLVGHNLRDEIGTPPDLMDLARVQFVMDGALKGLGAAHKAGIVHRDLKPENLFIAQTDDGEVAKLLDFGIARVESSGTGITRTGTLMGTASYMAPEQVSGASAAIGPWTDVYAMGAILYELLTGTLAFGGVSITDVLTKVLRAQVKPLRSVRADLPEAIYELVDRCLKTAHASRPATAEEMRLALAAARLVPLGTTIPNARANPDATSGVAPTIGITGAAVPSATPSPITASPVAPEKRVSPVASVTPPPAAAPTPDVRPRSRLALGAAIGGAAALALGGGAYLALRSHPDAATAQADLPPGDKLALAAPADAAPDRVGAAPAADAAVIAQDRSEPDPRAANAKPGDVPAPPDVAGPPSDASRTAKGVFYKPLKSGGSGRHPGPTDTVKVDYIGWTTDGHMFDSAKRSGFSEFPLDNVIPGWTDGLQTMAVGDRTRFWIPGALGYGDRPPQPEGPPQGMLVFDVTLLGIKPGPKRPAVAAPATGNGTLMVSTKPTCLIIIDGTPTGLSTPQPALPIAAGAHKVTLVSTTDAALRTTLSVEIHAGVTTKLVTDLTK